jgi:hypothetical protein
MKENTMWVILMRQPRPDAAYWPGRLWIAAVDAVVWPSLWVWAAGHAPAPVGLFGPMVTALAVVLGLRRLYRAVFVNHRYRFTTWRWGRWLGVLMVLGFVLKLTLRP